MKGDAAAIPVDSIQQPVLSAERAPDARALPALGFGEAEPVSAGFLAEVFGEDPAQGQLAAVQAYP